MQIIAKNYRAFSQSHPLKLEIADGVTAFVGPNNAGKSFVLKFFYEFRNVFTSLTDPNVLLGSQTGVNVLGVNDFSDIFHKYSNEDIELVFKFDSLEITTVINRKQQLLRVTNFGKKDLHLDSDQRDKTSKISISGQSIIVDIQNQREVVDLQTLFECFRRLARMAYIPAFRNAINLGAQGGFYDTDAGEAFIRSWHSFSTSTNPITREKCIEIKNDLKELFGYRDLNIIADTEKKQIIVNINDKSFLLSELGSGIAQFILAFINAAVRQPSFLLIDEPELNLHPKLQTDFVTRLLKFTERGILFATHNLGLAHSVAQRIYSVSKVNEYESIIKPFQVTSNFSEFLGEMNFSNFSDLGLKNVLLVEGPTEIQVFSVLLHKVNKYKEVMLWSLGGDSIINSDRMETISELKRLGSEVKILGWIDSERKSAASPIPSKRLSFQQNCKKLGIMITVSERRSIENYFPAAAVEKVNPKVTGLGPYDGLPPEWVKGSNWRMAQAMEVGNIESTDLGAFLTLL